MRVEARRGERSSTRAGEGTWGCPIRAGWSGGALIGWLTVTSDWQQVAGARPSFGYTTKNRYARPAASDRDPHPRLASVDDRLDPIGNAGAFVTASLSEQAPSSSSSFRGMTITGSSARRRHSRRGRGVRRRRLRDGRPRARDHTHGCHQLNDCVARIGDRAWRELLELHNQVIRRELQRFGGRGQGRAGDGFFRYVERRSGAGRPLRALAAVDEMEPAAASRIRLSRACRRSRARRWRYRDHRIHEAGRPSLVQEFWCTPSAFSPTRLAFEARAERELKGVPAAGTCIGW